MMISIFLPIRKGSKRIKNKNIRKFGKFNLGLTEIKIKQIKKFIDFYKKKINFELIVATDCPKVLKYCKKFKWVKIFKRNQKISGDHSLQKIIKLVPNICSGDLILWTHVTSPLFNSYCYVNFLNLFLKKKNNKRSAFSADIIQKFLYKKKWISHNYKKIKWPRTQDLEPIYAINSAAFISSRNIYLKNNDRLCKNPIPIVSKKNSGFDIDDIEDLDTLKKFKISI